MKDEYKEMLCRVRFIDGVPAQTYLSDIEIVRCKDCKWYEQDIGCDWGVCFHDDWTHRDVGHGVDGDGYCYRAERKEE